MKEAPIKMESPSPVSPSKYPVRIRKRNRFFFNDDEETEPPRRVTKAITPSRRPLDKKRAQDIALKLRTLLKLPKANRWVIYEFFYANIDQPLFVVGENDFQRCLRELLPKLKTRMLRRVEWCRIRRLFGRPRRCSQAFLAEERAALEMRRAKLRSVSQVKTIDPYLYRDLPDLIPQPLVVGAVANALLSSPHNALLRGTIEAIDVQAGTYRIAFERSGVGTLVIPDFEVASEETPQFLPLNSFQSRARPSSVNQISTQRFLELLGDQMSTTMEDVKPTPADLLNYSMQCNANSAMEDGSKLGPYPIKLMSAFVKCTKILNIKRRKIYELKMMNREIERFRSLNISEPISYELKKEYAATIMELEKLNQILNDNTDTIRSYSEMLEMKESPEQLIENQQAEAKRLIEQASRVKRCETSERSVELITNLVSIMLNLKEMNNKEINSDEVRAMRKMVDNAKRNLTTENKTLFEDYVEIHINHMENHLDIGNLAAFNNKTLID